MNDIVSVVDWSRWQFAMTAIYHWLFVPLTLGLSVIVAVMESIYLKTGDKRWLHTTKFWMTLLAINFAIGVATGIILEFEFGTNWSNYSWFVGDIFGAPLAIEGILAFFMEATFGAVMFFGWGKVSPKFHLASTWLTAIGASISALWILVANAWMQYPVGMEFDPAQMRNVMDNFWALFSSVAVHKFFHAVLSGWALSGVFVIGISCFFLFRKSNRDFALRSIKVSGWIGLIGLLLCMYTGDGTAIDVTKTQPMKLAAMEGLYDGSEGQSIVAFGIINPEKKWDNDEDPYLFDISIPYGLSLLARHNIHAYVPGIQNIIEGVDVIDGDTINTVPYPERMERGRVAQQAIRDYGIALREGNQVAADSAQKVLAENYRFFGFGYFKSPADGIPPVAITFYAFHVMVILGSYFLLFYVVVLFLAYKAPAWLTDKKWMQWISMLSVPLMWICSEAGWIVAEVGRQPWTVQDLLPVGAAISDIPASSVVTTFWIFAAVFTILLCAEVSIMVKWVVAGTKKDIDNPNN